MRVIVFALFLAVAVGCAKKPEGKPDETAKPEGKPGETAKPDSPPAKLVTVQPRVSIKCENENGISALAIAADGNTAIVQGYGKAKNVQIWDLSKQKKLYVYDNLSGSVLPVTITPDAKLAVYAAYYDFVVCDVATGEVKHKLKPKTGSIGFPHAPRLTPAGDVMAVAAEKRILAWNLQSGEEVFAWDASENEVTTLSAFFDNGRRIASGDETGTVKVWDVATGKPVQTIKAGEKKILSMAVTADGKTLVTAELFGPIKVWDLAAAKEVRKIAKAPIRVESIVLLQDEKLMVYTSVSDILIEEVRSGAQRYKLQGHSKAVWALAPLPGGSSLASASDDDTIKIWDLK